MRSAAVACRNRIGRCPVRLVDDGLERGRRITTNGRIFKAPSLIGDAFAFCENLLAQPHCQPVEPGERHWVIFRDLCLQADVRGPRVTDAWLAALAIEWGSQWITLDRDFARFPGLDWRVPGKRGHWSGSSPRDRRLTRGKELRLELARRHRLAEEIALPFLASHAEQEVGDGAAFDAFGDDGQAELPAQADGRADDRGVVGIGEQVAARTTGRSSARRAGTSSGS